MLKVYVIFPKLGLCTQKPFIHKRKAQTNLPDLRATTIPKQKKRFRSASELGLALNYHIILVIINRFFLKKMVEQ